MSQTLEYTGLGMSCGHCKKRRFGEAVRGLVVCATI